MPRLNPELIHERLQQARLFLIVAIVAILGAGVAAAAGAHAPDRKLLWMVAYLVLVVGVAQAILGAGQVLLPRQLPTRRFMMAEFILFNLGNIGVIAGSLYPAPLLVAAATLVFVISLLMFLNGVRDAKPGWFLHAFRILIALVCCGAIVGLVLSGLGITR